MCSIAGAHHRVARMLKTMNHRSPDGIKVVDVGGYQMGMGRLAIIDPTNDKFPYEAYAKVLSFNGEIYNYIELREELKELGYKFDTDGDTEVLLTAYHHWGEACLDKLNGMFAFAIYHRDSKSIFFARDVAGEKPFYYLQHKGNFYFASEAKALGYQCRELEPGSCGIYDTESKDLTIWKWWNFIPGEVVIEDMDFAMQRLEELLEDSIRLRTRSDVPYGLYLSGGVDSTLISTFHNFAHTFTYEDGDHKEEFLKTLRKIVWHLDYPLDSFSSFGLWKLAEQAKAKGVKVVLSGEGADELFGGYVRYVPEALNLKARDMFPSYKNIFPLKKEMIGWEDFNDKMRGLLRMGDRMAAAHGIENRCPFLDRRIIEFAFSLSPKLRAYGFDTKIILRKILDKRKPGYVHQEKHGLYCSVNEWLGKADKFGKLTYLLEQYKIWKSFQ